MKKYIYSAAGAMTAMLTAVPAFASDSSVSNVAITSEMLKPLVEGVTANIGVILPIGIGLFAIIIGVNMVPKMIKKFLS